MGKHDVPTFTPREVAEIMADQEQRNAMHYGDELAEIIGERGYTWEPVGDAADGGIIANVTDSDDQYLYTVTISRTPGH